MDAAKLGRFIAETRKARGMTQAQLGARLYVTDKTVSKWERGAGFPDIRTLEPLAEALEVSLVDLMRGERTETESIPVETAEAMLTETLALTRERRPVEYLLGWGAVAAFGVAVLLLLLLLLTNGKIVAYSVTSLCLGLGAWLIPLLSLTWVDPGALGSFWAACLWQLPRWRRSFSKFAITSDWETGPPWRIPSMLWHELVDLVKINDYLAGGRRGRSVPLHSGDNRLLLLGCRARTGFGGLRRFFRRGGFQGRGLLHWRGIFHRRITGAILARGLRACFQLVICHSLTSLNFSVLHKN